MKAAWNGVVIAQSDETAVVEGNHYFPPDSLNLEHLRPSETHTVCGWKGLASYYDIVVGDETNRDGAWFYHDPKPAAHNITNFVAFWKGVEVTE